MILLCIKNFINLPFQISVKIPIDMDRNELLQLYYSHVLPKPQRQIFKSKSENTIRSIHTVSYFKKTHSPEKRSHSPEKRHHSPEKRPKIETKVEESSPPKKKFKRIEFP